MSDDQYLIDRARRVIEGNMKPTLTIPQPEGDALLRRIRELESRLATAEADALERAAKWHDEQAEVAEKLDIKKVASFHRDAAFEIRSLKPKADETKKAGE